MSDLDIERVLQDIVAKNPDLILCVGGIPCQPWSDLGNARGEDDARASTVQDFVRIRDGIRDGVMSRCGASFLWAVEEVASMSE